MWREALDVRDPLVQRQDRPAFRLNGSHKHRVVDTTQTFIEDGMDIVAGEPKVVGNFDRQILVEFELHKSERGMSDSSLASSAA